MICSPHPGLGLTPHVAIAALVHRTWPGAGRILSLQRLHVVRSMRFLDQQLGLILGAPDEIGDAALRRVFLHDPQQ